MQSEKEDRSCAHDQAAMENLFQVLEKLQKILRNTLNEAKENVSKSIDNFLVDKVRQMGSMIGHYFTAFESLNVMSRKGMEEMIKQMYNYECIRDMEEELYETEEEWNLFLQEVDSKINPSSKVSKEEQVVVGSKGPCELKLIEVSTERHCSVQDLLTSTATILILLRHFAWLPWRDHVTQVQQRIVEFEAQNAQVIVVSFGNVDGAKKWIQDTKCEFKMFVDPKRQLYISLGLKRSVAKVWGISALVYYAEQKRAGRKLVAMFEEDDPMQMGGDFVLDKQGNLALVHCSKVPTDRPSVEELLKCIKGLN